MIRATIAVSLVIGLVIGCSELKIRDPLKAFDEANQAYSQALRWSEYYVAATFLEKKDEDKVETQIKHLSQYRVTAYEIRAMNVVEKDVRVRQIVKISYFKKDDLVVKSIADDQLWEYDKANHTWILATGLPKLK